LVALQSELQQINSQIDIQKSRVILSEDSVTRYKEFFSKNYVSKEQLQQKQVDLLDQRSRLQVLERDRISAGREFEVQNNEFKSLPIKHQNQLSEIDRVLESTNQELSESEAKRRIIISAPEGGIITALSAEVGQVVDSSVPLLTIVPQNAKLQAHLYAQSKAIGFIKPGDTVLLRYQAYPYQKFGHAQGKIVSVSRTAMSNNELAIEGMSGIGNGEPLYRITVELAKQTVSAYGSLESLQAGMRLEGDVLLERRRIIEWVLEPLLSISGKL
jgi:membrane fusion protein